MTWIQALVLAIVEGLTEFLPVSSTAQMLLVDKIWEVENREFFGVFVVFIQLGAMLAVLAIFLKQLWQSKNIWGKLIVGIIPTLILGFFFSSVGVVQRYLVDASALTGWVLIVGAVVFTGLDWWWRKREKKNEDEKLYVKEVKASSYKKMALVGVAQAVAMVPGVSRSGAVIFGARGLGFSKMGATQLSFIVGLPVIAAAAGWTLVKEFIDRGAKVVCNCVTQGCECLPAYNIFNHPEDFGLLGFGFGVAFIVAFLTARWLIKILGAKPFWWWGVYRVIVGVGWLMVV
jgi:undecaprenyl-diphosphatase